MKELHDPFQLLLDIDGRAAPKLAPFFAVLHICGLNAEWFRIDRTARGWHVVIRLKEPLELPEAIALQAAMGSDARREALNIRRAISLRIRPDEYWKQRANILFEFKL